VWSHYPFSHLVTIYGNSYRLGEKRLSGLSRPRAGVSLVSSTGGTSPPKPAKEA
jgi:hypothetical protein